MTVTAFQFNGERKKSCWNTWLSIWGTKTKEFYLGSYTVKKKSHFCFLCTPTLTTCLTRRVGVFPTAGNDATPAECPYSLTQLWPYLPGNNVSSHRLRSQSCRTSLTSDTNCKSRLLPVFLTGCKLKSPTSPPQVQLLC